MTVARCETVDDRNDGVYHCMARCVRRAFLCGEDAYTQQNFDHRKVWVRERLKVLYSAFGIEVYAYAVMSNHLHVVLRNRPDRVCGWTEDEVARRWLRVFPKRRRLDGQAARPAAVEVGEIVRDPSRAAELRGRLASISWFMKSLNEFIARRANREDACGGRFWEGRFKCQPLLDEPAILTCMAYVDLNPVRAGLVASPAEPQFTAAFDRIEARGAREKLARLKRRQAAPVRLTPRQQELQKMERVRARRADWLARLDAEGSPLSHVSERSYLELLDWTGRQIREDKRGEIPMTLAPILTRIEINADRWMDTVSHYGSLFHRVVGRAERLLAEAARTGARWIRGVSAARAAFTASPQPT